MAKVGGKFTTAKRNLVTYIENEQYEQLRQLAALYGRSVSAEAAVAIQNHLKKHMKVLDEAKLKEGT